MMLARNVRLPEAEFGISRMPKAYKNPPASLREALRAGLSPGACRTLNAVSARRDFGT
jgi:hypothetical protein